MSYQSERVWWGRPPPDSGQRPSLQHLLCVLINSHDWLTSDTQKTGNKLVTTTHLFLKEREGGVEREYSIKFVPHQWKIRNFNTISCTKEITFFSYLDKEESDSIGPQRSTELNIAKLCIDLAEVVQLAVVSKDRLLGALDLDVLSWEKLLQCEEAWFVLGFIVVAVLDLTLEGSELDGLVTSAGVSPINYGITRLHK